MRSEVTGRRRPVTLVTVSVHAGMDVFAAIEERVLRDGVVDLGAAG